MSFNLDDSLNFDILCTICGGYLEKENEHILPCTHKFHYDCLIKYFQYDISHPRINKCPYCRTVVNYLPLKNGMTPLKYIHAEYKKKEKKESSDIDDVFFCCGNKKDGSSCKNRVKVEGGKCFKHSLQS
jgi:hypothetical protein